MAGAGHYCGKFLFSICGPKCSLCCFILSIWAVVMLGSLGIFFFVEATALFEDIHGKLVKIDNKTSELHGQLDTTYYDPADVTKKYQNAAFSCWAATGIYIFFLSLSGAFVCINRWKAKLKET